MHCENDKIRLISHSSLSSFGMSCTDFENIRLTSYSSFVNVLYVTCTDSECGEVDEVREERLRRRRECDRRERKRN